MNNDFTNNRRATLMLLSIIIVIGLIGAVIVYLFTEATAAPTLGNVPPLCSDDASEIEHARALVQQGLDNALMDHAQHLLSVWIRDNVNESQRAAVGITNGVRAYFHGHRQIDAWVIPSCKEVKP